MRPRPWRSLTLCGQPSRRVVLHASYLRLVFVPPFLLSIVQLDRKFEKPGRAHAAQVLRRFFEWSAQIQTVARFFFSLLLYQETQTSLRRHLALPPKRL